MTYRSFFVKNYVIRLTINLSARFKMAAYSGCLFSINFIDFVRIFFIFPMKLKSFNSHEPDFINWKSSCVSKRWRPEAWNRRQKFTIFNFTKLERQPSQIAAIIFASYCLFGCFFYGPSLKIMSTPVRMCELCSRFELLYL
jgi:hypothetical protein